MTKTENARVSMFDISPTNQGYTLGYSRENENILIISDSTGVGGIGVNW